MTLHVLDNGSSKQPVSCHVLDGGVKKAVASAFRLVNGTKEQVYSSVLPDYSSITINDLTITKYASNPVISPSSVIDQHGMRNSILYKESGVYYMYYNAMTNATVYDPDGQTCVASSTDMVNFTKHGAILAMNGNTGSSGSVIKHEDTYYMYPVYDPATGALGTKLATASAPLGTWAYYNSGALIIDTTVNFTGNTIMLDPTGSGYTWIMFGCRVAATNQIGVAYSNDLITWTTPVTVISIAPQGTGWRIENPQVVKVGANYFMFVFGYSATEVLSGNAGVCGIMMYRASNAALTTWTYLGEVAMNSGNGTDWDWACIDFPMPYVVNNSMVRCFYNGGQNIGDMVTSFGIDRKIGFVDIVFP